MRVIMTRTCTFTSMYRPVDVSRSFSLSLHSRALAFDGHALPHVFADITQIKLTSMPRTCTARIIFVRPTRLLSAVQQLTFYQHVAPLAPFSPRFRILFAILPCLPSSPSLSFPPTRAPTCTRCFYLPVCLFAFSKPLGESLVRSRELRGERERERVSNDKVHLVGNGCESAIKFGE